MNSLELRNAITRSPSWGNSGELTMYLSTEGLSMTDVQKNKATRAQLEAMAAIVGIDPSAEYEAPQEAGESPAPVITKGNEVLSALDTLRALVSGSMAQAAPSAPTAPASGGGAWPAAYVPSEELEVIQKKLEAVAHDTFENGKEIKEAKKSVEGVEKNLADLSNVTAETLKRIVDAFHVAPVAVKRAVATVASGSSGLTPAEVMLAKYVPAGSNVNANCALLIGASGTGKSWAAEMHGKNFDFAPAPFGCTPATESWELFGCVTQTEAGLNYVDGYLSECFRRASDGATVCITLDELPRLAENVKQCLLTILTPRHGTGVHAGKTVFALRSGRGLKVNTEIKDGAGAVIKTEERWVMESLEAPVENVAFIGTGNIGDAFGVPSGSIDEAVFKRFVHARINWDAKTAQRIFESELKASGIKADAKALVQFVTESRILVNTANDLAYPACIRTVVRAIRNTGDVEALKAELEYLCRESLSNWERDGETAEQSLNSIKTRLHPIIEKISGK